MTTNASPKSIYKRRPSLLREASGFEQIWFGLHETLETLGRKLVDEYGFQQVSDFLIVLGRLV